MKSSPSRSWRHGLLRGAATVSLPIAMLIAPAPAWSAEDIRLVAHRGVHKIYGEDTVESQVEAMRLGATCAETDLRISADGYFVQMHDFTVDRTTDGTGPIHEMNINQIRRLRTLVGNNSVPTLNDSLAALQAIGGCLKFEVTGFHWSPSKVAEMWEIIASYGMQGQVVGYSGNLTYVRWLRDHAPDLEVVLKSEDKPTVDQVQQLEVEGVVPRHRHITPDFVGEMHAVGVAVYLPLANSAQEWQRVIDAGADGLMTDKVSAFRRWYAQQGG